MEIVHDSTRWSHCQVAIAGPTSINRTDEEGEAKLTYKNTYIVTGFIAHEDLQSPYPASK